MQVWQLQEPFGNEISENFIFRNFLYIQKTYPVGTNEKSDFYKLLQQHKQLKTMEIIEGWTDICNEGYIYQFQP